MGVNTVVYLPTDVSARGAQDVIGILAGLDVKARKSDHSDTRFADVDGVEAKATSVESMTDIVIRAGKGHKLVDGDEVHSCSFHYGTRFRGKIWNMMYPKSTPFWIALSKKLIKFFGGIIVFRDSDYYRGKNIMTAKRSCPVDRYGFIPDDGAPFQRLQDAIMKVKPLTKGDLAAAWKLSAYSSYFEKDGFTEKAEERVRS
jgi:hypothetical protein